MTMQLDKTQVVEKAPERKISDVMRDSRTLAHALTTREQARSIDFYEALTLLQSETAEAIDKHKQLIKTASGWDGKLKQETYKILKKYEPEIRKLSIATVNDLYATIDRHDLDLLKESVPMAEREAGRKVTQNLLRWLTDLAKF